MPGTLTGLALPSLYVCECNPYTSGNFTPSMLCVDPGPCIMRNSLQKMAQDCFSSLISNISVPAECSNPEMSPNPLLFGVYVGIPPLGKPNDSPLLPSQLALQSLGRHYLPDTPREGEYRVPPLCALCPCLVLSPQTPCLSQSTGFQLLETRVITFILYPQDPTQEDKMQKTSSYQKAII